MRKVKFEEVATRVNTREDKDNTSLLYYVGGDHIESREMVVHNRGLIEGSTIGPMFYYGFKKGDILLVSRNPHLRKAAVVNFDGICSEKTFVIGTKDEKVLLQRYLAVVVQTDSFWDYCEEHKSGGVNFFVNWSTLAKYEFELPDIEEQRIISDKVWAAYEVKESYRKLISATNEMVKSRFIEEFQGKGYQSQKLSSIAQVVTGSTPSRSVSDYWLNGTHPWVSAQDMSDKFVDASAELVSDLGMATCKLIPAGSLLYVCRGSIGVMSINRIDCATNQSICSAICDVSICKTEYLYYWLLYHEDEINSLGEGTSFKSLSQKTFASLEIQIPPIEEQLRFIEITRQADKSKFNGFKSRFFEQFADLPFDHKWKDVLTIINGKAYGEEYKVSGTYPICGSGGIMGYGEKKLCNRDSIILGRKGNIDKPIYMSEDYWIVDTAFCLSPNTELIHPVYLYHWCKQFDFQKLNKQAVLPSLTRTDLEQIDIQVPEMVEQLAFVAIVRQADKSKYLN